MYDDNDGCLVFLIPAVILIACFGIFFEWQAYVQTIMLDGEPPFYCPRCGVAFSEYHALGRLYRFHDDGTVCYEDGAGA